MSKGAWAMYRWSPIMVACKQAKAQRIETEFLMFSSPWHAEAISHLDIHLKIGGSVITPSSSIKNLGITFDSSQSMKLHVSALCRSINFHLRNLCRIKRFVDCTTCAHAARSLILSRQDYGIMVSLCLVSSQNPICCVSKGSKIVRRVSSFSPISVLASLPSFTSCIGYLSSRESI